MLPGDFKADAVFSEEVSSATMADTVESEMKRAGFEVIDRGNFASSVDALRASYARGTPDPSLTHVMTIGKMKDVKWVVLMDMQSATKINQAQPSVDQRPATPEEKNESDKFLAILGVVADLADQRTVDLWKLKVNYRIVDRDTAKPIHHGSVEDILITTRTLSKTLVSYTVMPPDVSFHMMMRRVVQLAVAQIDDLLAPRQ